MYAGNSCRRDVLCSAVAMYEPRPGNQFSFSFFLGAYSRTCWTACGFRYLLNLFTYCNDFSSTLRKVQHRVESYEDEIKLRAG